MSYRFVYPNGCYDYRRSYSPESFSSDSESSDDYEYRGRTMTRETRQPRDMVGAPPPIIKRVVKRTPTPAMEPPPSRSVQKEMNEEHSSPIVRTRVIKVNRPIYCGFSQPGSPYDNYRMQPMVGSVRQPAVSSFSSTSTFEYVQPPPPPPMMMMPASQPVGAMQQQQQQQMMYQPVQMQSSYIPQNYMYPFPQYGMSFGYRPMMQQTRMIPIGMPMSMMATGNPFARPGNSFPNQLSLFNPMVQPLVY